MPSSFFSRNWSRLRRTAKLIFEFVRSHWEYPVVKENYPKIYVRLCNLRPRYRFHLLHILSTLDYDIHYHIDLGNIDSETSDISNFRLSDLPFCKVSMISPASKRDFILISDCIELLQHSQDWRSRIYVDYDCFGRDDAEFAIPYGMHPAQVVRGHSQRLEDLRNRRPRVKFLFAGACQTSEYANPEITDLFGLTPRNILYDILNDVAKNEELHVVRSYDALMNANNPVDLAIIATSDTEKNRIEVDYWMDVLSSASFFVAGPGICMPMSHNVIEAMSVGTIPIVEYPNLFTPSLNEEAACVPFDGRHSFRQVVERCLKLDDDVVESHRQRVLDYYRTYLDVQTVSRKLQSAVLPSADKSQTSQRPIRRVSIIAEQESVAALKGRQSVSADAGE